MSLFWLYHNNAIFEHHLSLSPFVYQIHFNWAHSTFDKKEINVEYKFSANKFILRTFWYNKTITTDSSLLEYTANGDVFTIAWNTVFINTFCVYIYTIGI